MLVNNNVKLVITFINLPCIIELKMYVSWKSTPHDYSVRVIYPRVANVMDLSCILKDID